MKVLRRRIILNNTPHTLENTENKLSMFSVNVAPKSQNTPSIYDEEGYTNIIKTNNGRNHSRMCLNSYNAIISHSKQHNHYYSKQNPCLRSYQQINRKLYTLNDYIYINKTSTPLKNSMILPILISKPVLRKSQNLSMCTSSNKIKRLSPIRYQNPQAHSNIHSNDRTRSSCLTITMLNAHQQRIKINKQSLLYAE